jgi:hypothetical protein
MADDIKPDKAGQIASIIKKFDQSQKKSANANIWGAIASILESTNKSIDAFATANEKPDDKGNKSHSPEVLNTIAVFNAVISVTKLAQGFLAYQAEQTTPNQGEISLTNELMKNIGTSDLTEIVKILHQEAANDLGTKAAADLTRAESAKNRAAGALNDMPAEPVADKTAASNASLAASGAYDAALAAKNLTDSKVQEAKDADTDAARKTAMSNAKAAAKTTNRKATDAVEAAQKAEDAKNAQNNRNNAITLFTATKTAYEAIKSAYTLAEERLNMNEPQKEKATIAKNAAQTKINNVNNKIIAEISTTEAAGNYATALVGTGVTKTDLNTAINDTLLNEDVPEKPSLRQAKVQLQSVIDGIKTQ